MNHEQFQEMLDKLAEVGVGQEVLGEVLARVSLKAPEETSRIAIAAGNPAARRAVDQRAIPQGTVSKAVKALMDEGLLEAGERALSSPDGRPLLPIRLGGSYAIAGVKVTQSGEQPRQVTTALLGLDGNRDPLGTAHDPADHWDQATELIHRHVASLKSACDQDRAARGLKPLRMLGVGIEVGSPVYNGEVMPHLSDSSAPPVALAAALHRLFETDPSFGQALPVVVENDVNALAVLAIHQSHYAEPDLVVVGVFDEGVGGGLVMDGRLRRGGNGRAMEIGHLAVSFPPGQQEQPDPHQPGRGALTAGLPDFYTRCWCGHFGHVDTLAPPRRIQGMLGDVPLDQLGDIGSLDPRFEEAQRVFGRSGAALGRALAHVSNTVNPSRIITYLPAPLARPKPGTAAASYRSAVRQEVTSTFAGGDGEYLEILPLPAKSEDLALLGARAAAICVLESFIEHALRLDGCTTTLRRPGTNTGSFPVLHLLGNQNVLVPKLRNRLEGPVKPAPTSRQPPAAAAAWP
jgi:predicted NBD/HSP70 family sugar kinase